MFTPSPRLPLPPQKKETPFIFSPETLLKLKQNKNIIYSIKINRCHYETEVNISFTSKCNDMLQEQQKVNMSIPPPSHVAITVNIPYITRIHVSVLLIRP